MSKRRDDWIDESEYPDERDMDDLGEDSPVDYDRLTMGRVGNMRQPFWTRTRIFVALFWGLLILGVIAAGIAPLFRR